MNVVMVGPFGMRPLGTMRARALPMAKALAIQGHAVTLVLPPWRNPEDSGRSSVEGGVAVENIHLPRRIPGVFHPIVAARLAMRAVRARPDVIHAFKPKAYSGLAHWLLRSVTPRRRPPIVVDTDDWEGPGGWNELGAYSQAQKAFFAWQERWGLAHADAVTVASRTLESQAWAAGVDPAATFYVPNGIFRPFPGPQRDHASWNMSGPVILLYTRFVEFPVSRVLDLLTKVGQRVSGARLRVVGAGLRGEELVLLAQAEARGLSECVTVAPYEADLLPDEMARCALAIYPMDDTLVNRAKSPAKLMELLAAGVPVVADRVGEAAEYVRHGETGWLVEPGDLDGFADGVSTLLDDPDLRLRLGRAAAQDVRDRYSWDQAVESVLRAYQVAGERR